MTQLESRTVATVVGRPGIDAGDRRVLARMGVTVLALHLLGIGLLLVSVGQGLRLADGGAFGLGLGLTAYLLGARHAFDADHIAAVDNTTRALVRRNRRPLSVGLWFALGHSTVLVALCLLLAFGVRSLASQLTDENSRLHLLTGAIGATVSGGFLLLIGVVNLVVLVRLLRMFRRMRDRRLDEDDLARLLERRGPVARLLGPLTRAVRLPRHIYPVGLLFGLGFDTATEVSLLALAGGTAMSLPWYAILSLPLLFTAGMCLFDTADGILMRGAYGWAFDRPVRRVYYNVAVTTVSVVTALAIGVIVIAGLLSDYTRWDSAPIRFLAGLDLGGVGYAVFVLFLLTWAVSALIWKVFRIEDRWSRTGKATS